MRCRASLLSAMPALAGCSGSPLSYLDATSPVGGSIASLGIGLLAISVLVCVVIGLLLVVALRRGTRRTDPVVTAVDDRAAIRWIGAGVAISTVLLLGAAVWTLVTVRSLGEPVQADTLRIDVTGQEWWWSIKYHSDDPAREFTTADQLVIPVDVPVQISLTSRDVIHSFWVPKLGGKTDMVPSRTNVTWFKADKVGNFRGQCSEFCGLQHANMAFTVQVLSKPDFEAWWNQQLQPAVGSMDDPRFKTFMTRCAACHTVRGTAAGGILGPDLSHFAGRETIAAGLMPNTPANLARWINNTQTMKPGVKMPELDMLASEIDDVTSYLEGLK
jgi:cytochrome c oxidase subunit II